MDTWAKKCLRKINSGDPHFQLTLSRQKGALLNYKTSNNTKTKIKFCSWPTSPEWKGNAEVNDGKTMSRIKLPTHSVEDKFHWAPDLKWQHSSRRHLLRLKSVFERTTSRLCRVWDERNAAHLKVNRNGKASKVDGCVLNANTNSSGYDTEQRSQFS